MAALAYHSRRMRIYRRGAKGIYWLQFRGQRISLKVTDRAAAELAAREIQRRFADPNYAAARARTVSDAALEYIDALPTAANRVNPPSPATLDMLSYHVAHLCRIFGADTDLASAATAAETARYIETRRTERVQGKAPDRPTVKAHTVAKELGTWRAILRREASQGRLHVAPELVVPLRVETGYEPLQRSLSWEQVPRLLWELAPERAAQCAFVIGLGADKCALQRARFEDFEPGSVLVRGSKNSRRFARVPIVSPFESLVAQAREWLASHVAFVAWRNAPRDLAAACERAGLPRVTLRDLRRTHGQVLRVRGVPPHLIGAMLRHADGRMAETTYGRLGVDALGKLVQRITAAPDPDADAAWIAELERRAQAVADGTATMSDWREALARVADRLKGAASSPQPSPTPQPSPRSTESGPPPTTPR